MYNLQIEAFILYIISLGKNNYMKLQKENYQEDVLIQKRMFILPMRLGGQFYQILIYVVFFQRFSRRIRLI